MAPVLVHQDRNTGRPFAIAIGVGEEDLEETIRLMRRVRSLRALSRLQNQAVERGASETSPEAIEEEIREVRRERKRLRPQVTRRK